jgi:hypothetical protein
MRCDNNNVGSEKWPVLYLALRKNSLGEKQVIRTQKRAISPSVTNETAKQESLWP